MTIEENEESYKILKEFGMDLEVLKRIPKKAMRIITGSLLDIGSNGESFEEIYKIRTEIIHSIERLVNGYFHPLRDNVPTMYLSYGLKEDIFSFREQRKYEVASNLEGISLQLEAIAGINCKR